MTISWLRIIPRPLIGKRGVLTSELPWSSLSHCYETDFYTFSSCKIVTLYPSPVPLNNSSFFPPCSLDARLHHFSLFPFYCLTVFDISCKWKHTVFVFFMTGLFPLSSCIKGSCMLQHVAKFPVWLNNVPCMHI